MSEERRKEGQGDSRTALLKEACLSEEMTSPVKYKAGVLVNTVMWISYPPNSISGVSWRRERTHIGGTWGVGRQVGLVAQDGFL